MAPQNIEWTKSNWMAGFIGQERVNKVDISTRLQCMSIYCRYCWCNNFNDVLVSVVQHCCYWS